MNKKDGMGNMRKIGMLLVALMLISIILLSGCTESSYDIPDLSKYSVSKKYRYKIYTLRLMLL